MPTPKPEPEPPNPPSAQLAPYATAMAKVDDSPPRYDAGAKLSRAVIEGNLEPFYYVLATEIMRGNVNAFREIWKIGYEKLEGQNDTNPLANKTPEQILEIVRNAELDLGIPPRHFPSGAGTVRNQTPEAANGTPGTEAQD